MSNSEKLYLFLCDRKKSCRSESICGNTCKHTTDITHAVNEIPHDSNEINFRFNKEGVYKSFELWWELEGDVES